MFERVLPGELELRGVGEAAGLCEALMDEIAQSPAAQSGPADADAIFRRLGGD